MTIEVRTDNLSEDSILNAEEFEEFVDYVRDLDDQSSEELVPLAEIVSDRYMTADEDSVLVYRVGDTAAMFAGDEADGVAKTKEVFKQDDYHWIIVLIDDDSPDTFSVSIFTPNDVYIGKYLEDRGKLVGSLESSNRLIPGFTAFLTTAFISDSQPDEKGTTNRDHTGTDGNDN